MKPTPQSIAAAVGEFGMLKYFPADEATRRGVMRLLARMVSTQEQLDWLVRTMVDRIGTWEGPAELRGVLSARYTPADGVLGDCSRTSVAGALFSPQSLESRSVEQHEQEKLLGAGVSVALLPAVREIEPDPPEIEGWVALVERKKLPPRKPMSVQELEEKLRGLGAI